MSIISGLMLAHVLFYNGMLSIAGSFTSPEQLGTQPANEFWLLPLAAAIVIVYKATKLKTITFLNFTKEVVVLFGSIVVFIFIAAVVLLAINWLILN